MGLDKLSSTKDVVATLQEELTVLQPQLVKTMKEVTLPVYRDTYIRITKLLRFPESTYPVQFQAPAQHFRASSFPPSIHLYLSFSLSPSGPPPPPSLCLIVYLSFAIDETINRALTNTNTTQVEDMMVEINADKEEAEVVRVKVEAEEATANEKVGIRSHTLSVLKGGVFVKDDVHLSYQSFKIFRTSAKSNSCQLASSLSCRLITFQAAATKAIADDAQRDLDLALPALESAVACLNSLKKADIDEVITISV